MCPECYSAYSRITPLLNPEDCLRNHRQYICQTCGRCICSAVSTGKTGKKYRAHFPFKTLDIAKLYLRSAEVIEEKPCGIYEIENLPGARKNNKERKSYKIFPDISDLNEYLAKTKGKKATSMSPLYSTKRYIPCSKDQLRRLTKNEVNLYLKEQKEQSKEWRHIIIGTIIN
jgi:hypothetical protein